MKRNYLALFCLLAYTSPASAVVLTGPGQTPVDLAAPLVLPPGSDRRDLKTTSVVPDADEKPFFDKVSPNERVTGSPMSGYSLRNKQNKYLCWYGIVRKIDSDSKAGTTVLTIQHTYADGLTDAHMMTVSCYGDGDFKATLKGTALPILPLRLVAVYGTVKSYADGIPAIEAAFVKEWDWGRFTFMDYGANHNNPLWNAQLKVDKKSIYHPYPDTQFYLDRLGRAPEQIFPSLSEQQRKKYAQAVLTPTGGLPPYVAIENAPRFVGTEAVLKFSGGGEHGWACKTEAAFVDLVKKRKDPRELIEGGSMVSVDAGTRVSITRYKAVEGLRTALYEVSMLDGPLKDQKFWLPGFALAAASSR